MHESPTVARATPRAVPGIRPAPESRTALRVLPLGTHRPQGGIRRWPCPRNFLFFSFFFSSLCLWLRSSVVSVLFSLIAECSALQNVMIILIFRPRDLASVLAHASLHSVIGLTLSPIDANSFSSTVRLVRALGEDWMFRNYNEHCKTAIQTLPTFHLPLLF